MELQDCSFESRSSPLVRAGPGIFLDPSLCSMTFEQPGSASVLPLLPTPTLVVPILAYLELLQPPPDWSPSSTLMFPNLCICYMKATVNF